MIYQKQKDMKTAYFISNESFYIDNATGNVCNPEWSEKLIDSLNGGTKFSFCEFTQIHGQIKAKTKKAIFEIAETQHKEIWNRTILMFI